MPRKTMKRAKPARKQVAKRAKPAAKPAAKRAVQKRRAARDNIDGMTTRQLLALQSRVDAAIAERQRIERVAIREKMEALARSAGFKVSEIFSNGVTGKASGKSKAAIKFRHPDNPALTWTGRGRRPRWLAEARGKIDRFRVS